jgi:sugar lactone lactonase YvrE
MNHQGSIRTVLPTRSRLGEGPLWDHERQRLFWLDIYNYWVHELDAQTGSTRIFDVGDVVGCIGLAGPDRLIMAQRDRLAFLDLQSGEVEPILAVEADLPANRFNDGKCDPQGRFWFGSMSVAVGQASLYRYDPDGSLQVMETGLTISNGLGWSPDNRTFYLTDSTPKLIYAYDFEPETGTIANRRTLIDLSHESFGPDGLTIDQDGHIWSAMWDGGCVIRFDPTGKEVSRLKLPVPRTTCCTFGGPDLTTLYITTASVGYSQAEIDQIVTSGDLFAAETGAIGLPSSAFGGQ